MSSPQQFAGMIIYHHLNANTHPFGLRRGAVGANHPELSPHCTQTAACGARLSLRPGPYCRPSSCAAARSAGPLYLSPENARETCAHSARMPFDRGSHHHSECPAKAYGALRPSGVEALGSIIIVARRGYPVDVQLSLRRADFQAD